MNYYYPFGEIVHPLVQQDRTPKKVFVLGVYASAVHARWKIGSKTICPAMAVASEPFGMVIQKKQLRLSAEYTFQKDLEHLNLQAVT